MENISKFLSYPFYYLFFFLTITFFLSRCHRLLQVLQAQLLAVLSEPLLRSSVQPSWHRSWSLQGVSTSVTLRSVSLFGELSRKYAFCVSVSSSFFFFSFSSFSLVLASLLTFNEFIILKLCTGTELDYSLK